MAESEVIYYYVKGQGWVPAYDDPDALLLSYIEPSFSEVEEQIFQDYLLRAQEIFSTYAMRVNYDQAARWWLGGV